MAEKRRIKARSVSNVAASKTALIDLPVGPRYHYILLSHGFASGTNTVAGACTNVSEVRIIVNDRVQRVFSGTQLRDLNILNGTQWDCQGVPNTSPGVAIPIFFAEAWRKDSKSQDGLAWVTAGMRTFRIEVDLSTASTPTLTATAVVDDFLPSVQPLFVTWRRQQVAAGGVAFDITTIDKKGLLQQVSLYSDSGGANQATIVTARRNLNDGKGSVVVHELPYADNFALLTNNDMLPTASGRTAKIYDMVFDHDDLINSALLLDGALEFSLTVEAASAMSGSVTFINQTYGNLI